MSSLLMKKNVVNIILYLRDCCANRSVSVFYYYRSCVLISGLHGRKEKEQEEQNKNRIEQE